MEQTIVDLARLMGNVDRDREEKRNLFGDLSQGRPNPRPIPEFDEIPFYDGRFSKKRFIKWLVELEPYFYFNKVTYYKHVGLVHKFSCGVKEWWFEFIDFRTCIGMPLISSWQILR